MNNQNQNLAKVTTWEAQQQTGIPAATMVAWIHGGHLAAELEKKGERDVYVFAMLTLQLFLLSEKAGKHQRLPQEVPISDVCLDPEYQLRAATKLRVIGEYRQLMDAGVVLPPVTLVRLFGTGDSSRLVLVDGYHRYHAHCALGLSHIQAKIVECCGTQEAFALALMANRDHGLQRSEADKRHVVKAMLSRPEYAALSVRDLASVCGVSHMTISRYRRRLGGTRHATQPSTIRTEPGTPSWIAAQIGQLAAMLRVTNPEASQSLVEVLKRHQLIAS